MKSLKKDLRKRLMQGLGAAGLMLALGGSLHAQEPVAGEDASAAGQSKPGDKSADKASDKADKASDKADKTGDKKAKPPTAEEISKKSSELQEQMSQDLVHVGRLQQKARKDKDVIKLNCVNDKLVQMKAMMNLADDKRTQITDALTLGNGRAPEHFTDYTRSSSDIKKLREEADVCVGVGPDYLGDSKLNVSNPGIPDDPTASSSFDDGVEPPAYASPFS